MAVTYAYPVQVFTSLTALVAAIVLTFTGRYPRQLYGFVISLNTWVLRVGHAGLTADADPPFRLAVGGPGPAAMTMRPYSPGPSPRITSERPAADVSGAAPGAPRTWAPNRRAAVVTGVVLALCSIVLLGAGGAALWADTAGRDGGYVSLESKTYHSTGYAVATSAAELRAVRGGWDAARPLFGTIRIRATSTTADKPAFIGVAAPRAASDYLTGVAHATVRNEPGTRGVSVEVAGTAPAMPPTRAELWVARGSGSGSQTLIGPVSSRNRTIVMMNADGSRPVSVNVNVAARLPALTGIAAGLLTVGAVCLVAGVILIVITIRRSPGPTAPR